MEIAILIIMVVAIGWIRKTIIDIWEDIKKMADESDEEHTDQNDKR